VNDPTAAEAPVDCPRCGYDQSGALASFRAADAWPMRGRCPECGLDWCWGDLLHPARQMPKWLVENPRRAAALTLAPTWRRALRPRRFWSRVLVTLPIHRGRLVLYALFTLLLTYAVAGATSAWSEHAFGGRMFMPGAIISPSRTDTLLLAAAWPVGSGSYHDVRPLGPMSVLAIAWVLLMPLPFLALRQTFLLIRVRRIHLLRIWAYSLTPLPPLVLVVGLIHHSAHLVQSSITAWSGYQRTAWSVASSVLHADWCVALILGAWLALFWSRSIRLYLRLPNARLVITLMLIASFLGATAIAAYYPGSTLTQQVGSWFVWQTPSRLKVVP